MPLPPYIQKKRQSDYKDFDDYQTVYATEKGSIAAPTAGLHFNNAIISHLKKNNQLIEVTLHVGAGTFLPIRNDDLSLHKMHSEHGTISQKSVDRMGGGKLPPTKDYICRYHNIKTPRKRSYKWGN
jgi:S-adenosylmethionine:tRNA-ribosyltransferase-isomerase (queuine synthetase)